MFLDAFRSQQFVEAPEHAYPVPQLLQVQLLVRRVQPVVRQPDAGRSEEHTSELQSHSDLVCRLLLEKKKKKHKDTKKALIYAKYTNITDNAYIHPINRIP